MKRLIVTLIYFGVVLSALPSHADGCGAVAMDSDGNSVQCTGVKKCKAKPGKWVKCDGVKKKIQKQ